MSRQPNGRPAIYHGADGWWHCYYTVGRKPGGKLDRRHIRGRTASDVASKIEALEAKLRIGHVPELGKAPTLGEWFEHYLSNVAPRKLRGSTLQGYESKLRHHVIPAVGHLRMSTPVAELGEALEAFFRKLERKVKPATALQVYRIVSRALKIAAQRGKLPRNPCELFDPPAGGSDEIDALTVDEVRRILAAARDHGALVRWWVALALGLRQGEALGLMWDYVDLDSQVPTLTVRWELIRLKWRHGCEEQPCGKRAPWCPQRHGGGLVFERPKSRKGRRTLPLPAVIADLLRAHRRAQRKARMAASRWVQTVGPDGESGGLVFPNAWGAPRSPEDDWAEWKAILVMAGVRQVERRHQRGRNAGKPYTTSTVRVHDSRHSAATTMFAAGMDRRELMEWLGHSQIAVSARYTHVPEEMMRARADQLDQALRLVQPDGATTATGTDGVSAGGAGGTRTRGRGIMSPSDPDAM